MRILKSKKITRDEVADRLGFSPGYISKVVHGTKPLTQGFIDRFLSVFGNELEGVELVEVSAEKTVAAQIALEAKVEVLTDIVLGLVKSMGEISSNMSGRDLQTFIEKDTKAMQIKFDEYVEDAAAQLLKKRGLL